MGSFRLKLRVSLAATAALASMALAAGGGLPAQASNSSSGQLVVSTTGGFGTFSNTPTPFGYWIWCQSTSTNAYGVDCSGSAYFYALSPKTEQVAGTVTGSGSSGYTIDFWNTTGSFAMACELNNVAPPTNGPTNTVYITCSSPSGSGVSTNSIVSGSGTFKS
jgi:hypothetical protein